MPGHEIDKVHDKFVRKVLREIPNLVTFLKTALPEVVRQRLNLDEIELDPNSYISSQYEETRSDIVAKCRTRDEGFPTDIYILFEHKSYEDRGVLLQLLNYMNRMWEKDLEEKKPLRAIIPLVFYHGESEWQVPAQFLKQFHVPSCLQQFVPDFTYILFDTNDWDWQDESCLELRENVFLLSALLLLKAAFHKNLELIRQVFRLWHQLGFMKERERIVFLLIYVTATHELSYKQLNTMMDECKLKGDEIMPTLAQRWIEEGMLAGKQQDLIMLLSSRFPVSEYDKQIVLNVQEPERLNEALRLVINAQAKEEVLASLQDFRNS